VAILFLGIGSGMKVAVIIFGTSWPILINTIHGVQSLDPVLLETGRTFNLGRWAFLQKIVFPAALPGIMTGLRISLAISLILGITVEMIAGRAGLGFLILDYERSFKYAEMYAGIALLGVIGFLLNSLMARVETRLVGWARRGALVG
jgi:ABC-type nitrate/sulfonate/bicarbonate transport system permease component